MTFIQTDKPIYLPGQTGSPNLTHQSDGGRKEIIHVHPTSLSPFQGRHAGHHVQTCKRAGESVRTLPAGSLTLGGKVPSGKPNRAWAVPFNLWRLFDQFVQTAGQKTPSFASIFI